MQMRKGMSWDINEDNENTVFKILSFKELALVDPSLSLIYVQ